MHVHLENEEHGLPNVESRETYSILDAIKEMLGLSFPMLFSYTLGFQWILLVYLLSHLEEGEDNLASISLITSLLNIVITLGICPLYSMSIVAGREIGELEDAEENHEEEELLSIRRKQIASINHNGWLISTIAMLPMIGILVFAKPVLKHLFNQDESVAQIAQDFVRPYAINIPAIMLRICSEQIMFAFGKTKPAMGLALASFGVSMLIGCGLAFGWSGLPRMGKYGVLLGCIGESYLTALAFSFYIAKHSRFKLFNFFSFLQVSSIDKNQFEKMLRLSKSFVFTMSSETALILSNSIVSGVIGQTAQAALSRTNLFSIPLLLLQSAFGQSCSQEMSRKLGKKEFVNLCRLGKVGLLTTISVAAPLPLFFTFAPDLLIKATGGGHKMDGYFLPLFSIGCIADAARYSLLQELRVLGDARGAALSSSSMLAIGIVTSVVLGLKTNMGVVGVSLVYMTSNVTASSVLLYRWLSRIKPEVVEDSHPITPLSQNCFARFFRKAKQVENIELPNYNRLDENLLTQ